LYLKEGEPVGADGGGAAGGGAAAAVPAAGIGVVAMPEVPLPVQPGASSIIESRAVIGKRSLHFIG
jgi:hypothetical protein